MPLILLWLVVLFMMLGSTADDFFTKALLVHPPPPPPPSPPPRTEISRQCSRRQVLSQKMDLSERTAGVTLLALGNGAPDLFSVLNLVKQGEIKGSLGDLTVRPQPRVGLSLSI